MKDIKKEKTKKLPLFKRKGFRISLSVLVALLILGSSFIFYLISTGSGIFEDGINGASLLKTIYSKDQLKGENVGRVNILLAGMGGSKHPGGELTDSMMVLSVDTRSNRAAMISIPRDLYVPIPDHRVSTKINEAYSFGQKESKGSGASLMSKTVASVLGIPIDYYMTLDFEGFEKFIDQIGGIDTNVDKAIYDPLYPDEQMIGYDPFTIKAGQQHLNGKTALKFARSRESSSDFDRAARQQKIIKAVKDKIANLGFLSNPKHLVDMASVIGDHFRTNFTPSEMKRLAEIIKGLDVSKATSKVLNDGPGGLLVSSRVSDRYVLLPKGNNFDQIHSFSQDVFNAGEVTQTLEVEVLNGSGVSGLGSKVAENISNLGFSVKNISLAKEKSAKTIIYDYTNGAKQAAIDKLKNKIGGEVVRGSVPASGIEASVIIGNDYQAK